MSVLCAYSGSERKCSTSIFLVGYLVGQIGQKNGSARGNKEEEVAMLITHGWPLPDEALHFGVQFWLVMLEPGMD